MTKMIFALALTMSCQSMAWHLASESNNNPQEMGHCPQNVDLQEAADKSSVALLTSDNHQVWNEIENVGAGRTCHSHASWSPLGGYGCTEAWYSQGVYTYSDCGSDIGFWKCSPKLHHDDRRSVTVEKNQITFIADNEVMAGGPLHLTCVYR